ncbi:unnamed protein product, partial [Polarella glacialis]
GRGASELQQPADALKEIHASTAQLRAQITELLRSSHSCPQLDAQAATASTFDSVALTRYLRATTAAVKLGPAAKVSLPWQPSSNGSGGAGADTKSLCLPLLLDGGGISTLHEMFLPRM